jgi:hypothetical protein
MLSSSNTGVLAVGVADAGASDDGDDGVDGVELGDDGVASGVVGLEDGDEESGVVGLDGLEDGDEESGVIGLDGLEDGDEESGVVGVEDGDEESGVVGVEDGDVGDVEGELGDNGVAASGVVGEAGDV